MGMKGSDRMQTILTTNHLTKQIGTETIVSDLNMHIAKGEIYGFLGPNGAGKTTVMKMITNQWKPTSGDIVLFGEKLLPDSYSFLKRMGSIIEFPVFYNDLTAEENLKLHCEYMGYYSPDSVEKSLSLLSLSDNRGKKVKEFSLGMKQRLGIARAVLTKPEFLVLDEPTNGLDPAGMKQFRDLFRMLCKEYEMTILISSHLLSEIESLAHTIGIIHKGRLVKEISMKELTDKGLEYLEIKTSEITKASYVFTECLNISNFKVLNNNLIRVYTKQATSREIMKVLTENQIEIQGFHSQTESLEEYFLKVTGGESECGN
jgi:ABC-2 type transport system ATP-binding protein